VARHDLAQLQSGLCRYYEAKARGVPYLQSIDSGR
jgi:hypothetical protein